jgi:hypothetical protein
VEFTEPINRKGRKVAQNRAGIFPLSAFLGVFALFVGNNSKCEEYSGGWSFRRA